MTTHALRPRPADTARGTPAGPWPLVAIVAAIVALAIGWVGYTASDDAAYYQAAGLWLTHPPVAGADHWATRFPLILSLAGSLVLLGAGPAAMAATALGWYLIFLALVRDLARRIAGPRAGWLAVALLATLPVVVAQATTVSCDLAEASFLILGIRLIGDTAAGEPGEWRPFAAGLAFGGAILCRETTSLALFGFVPLFLIGRPVPRRALIVMAAGCALLIGGEALYQYALTGDPLHRWTLAFHHDSHIDRAANEEGNFLVNPVIDPLLVLLVNDDFALLFWLAIPAAALARHRLDAAGRRRHAILITTACATFLLVGALYTKLVLNPRYFMLPAVAAAITVAAWLDTLRPAPRAVLLAGAIGASLLMLSVENAHPRWAAQALVDAARTHPGVAIRSDPETVHRAELPLRWAGIAAVSAGPPAPGVLALTPESATPAGAAVAARYPSPPTMLGRLLVAGGMIGHVPAGIRHRLVAPNPTMILWRPGVAPGPSR